MECRSRARFSLLAPNFTQQRGVLSPGTVDHHFAWHHQCVQLFIVSKPVERQCVKYSRVNPRGVAAGGPKPTQSCGWWASFHHLPSVRGDLLAKLSRFDEARPEFERAAALTRNSREYELLLERARACSKRPCSSLFFRCRIVTSPTPCRLFPDRGRARTSCLQDVPRFG